MPSSFSNPSRLSPPPPSLIAARSASPVPPTLLPILPFTAPTQPNINQRPSTPPPNNSHPAFAPTPAPTTSPTPPNLRDHILASLASHPGTREFHVHALVSAPRRTGDLFPFATPRAPRVWVQDVLVLLSERALGSGEGKASGEEGNGAPARPCTPPPKTQADTDTPPRVLVAAVEAALYIIPSTSCGLLYVSKVDSSGHAAAPSPTARLVRAVLSFFVDPATRPAPARELVRHLYVHVFARAQAQYLFAASKEWAGKKPLGDAGLCAWWKHVLGRVAGEVVVGNKEGEVKVKMYYVLPGFGKLEAENVVRNAGVGETPVAGGLQWEYGHPYEQTDGTPLPCPRPPPDDDDDDDDDEGPKRKLGKGGLNLGCIIPSFDDDPKARFMDEMAYTTDGEVRSPQRKRARTAVDAAARTVEASVMEKDRRPLGELGKVTADEFWERMSFRQECVAGAVTGFFTLVVSSAGRGEGEGSGAPAAAAGLGPQAGQVSGQVHKRILGALQAGLEFGTAAKAARATETVEGAIRGLCGGEHERLEVPRTPPRRRRGLPMEVTPNPFPEAVATASTYTGHVYGRTATRNTGAVVAVAVEAGPEVRVLAVRRKKKAT